MQRRVILSGLMAASALTSVILLFPSVILLVPVLVAFFASAPTLLIASVVGLKLPVTVAGVAATDVLLGLWVAKHEATNVIQGRRQPIQFSRSTFWLILFFAWAWFVTVFRDGSITPLLRLSLYAFVAIRLQGAPLTSRRAVAIAVGIYAGAEILMTVPVIFRERLNGVTVGDPAQFGLLLLAALALLLGSRPRLGRTIAVAIVTTWTLATVTRGIWFSLVLMLVLSASGRMSFRRLLALFAVGIVGAFVLIGPVTSALRLNVTSVEIRQRSVESGLETLYESPLIGRGWAWYAALDDELYSAPYNLLVNVAVSLGVVGAALLVGYLVTLMRHLAITSRSAFLFCSAFLALSLTEMTIYAGSLGTLLFFLYTALPDRPLPAVSPDGALGATLSA